MITSVDANFLLFDLVRFFTYKINKHLRLRPKPHAPTMNGGALAEEPPMPKLELERKVFRVFLPKNLELGFCEKMG